MQPSKKKTVVSLWEAANLISHHLGEPVFTASCQITCDGELILALTVAVTVHQWNTWSDSGTLVTLVEQKSSEDGAVCQNMLPKGLTQALSH